MGFKHGRYLKFGQGNDDHQATAGFNTDASWKQKMEFEEVRLSNLYLTMLQKFGTASPTVPVRWPKCERSIRR